MSSTCDARRTGSLLRERFFQSPGVEPPSNHLRAPAGIEVNRLSDQVLVKYHEQDWTRSE